MDASNRFKMIDPDMDIRRLAKKLLPTLWVHHGVITNIPPAGPMSPARVTDTADRMSEAVLVFSQTLRPVMQYYLEKHLSAMEGSKISFWTHLAFLCLRIRLRRDHLFDYFLNVTAVVAECALGCRSRLDEVHSWAATFFCAFFEHELIGPFYSAGGWAGLVNYIQESDLAGVFERLAPMWSQGATTVLVTVASESLSAERRERITTARALRADEIERFEPAKILAAKIFHWDFSEKFPMSPLAPGAFRRTHNIRRKTRSKSESADTKIRLYSINVEPCAANSAPNLRYIHEAKPDGKSRIHTQRSISIDVKAKLSNLKGPYIPLTLQSDISSGTSNVEDEMPSVDEKSEVTSTSDLQRSHNSTSSLSVFEPICSPKTSFYNMKSKSPPRMLPKSLFPISTDENQTPTENMLTLEESQEGSSGVEYAPNNSRHRRFSLPNSNRRTLIDTMQEKNPAIFQTFIWKDDFTLRKSKRTKDQLSEVDDNNQIKDQNKNRYSLQKKTFSFEDIRSIYTAEPIGKNPKVQQCSHWRTSCDSMTAVETDAASNTNLGDSKHIFMDNLKTVGNCWKNTKVHQCSHWRTSYESMASVETDTTSNTNLDNSKNPWTDDSMKTETFRKTSKDHQCSHWRTSYESMNSVETDASSNTNLGNSKHIWNDDSMKSESDDLGELVAKLLLINVDEPRMNEDDNQIGVLSNTSNEQIYAKSPDVGATTFRSSYGSFEEEDTVSLLSTSSSGICENTKEYKMSRSRLHSNATSSYNSMLSLPSILKHSEFKSSEDPGTTKKEYEKPSSYAVNMLEKTKLSPSSSSDRSDYDDKVVIQPDTQTVLYKRRLLGSLAKRVRKLKSENQTETREKREMDPNFDFQTTKTKKEKDGKRISDIKRALKNSSVSNPAVFKI